MNAQREMKTARENDPKRLFETINNIRLSQQAGLEMRGELVARLSEAEGREDHATAQRLSAQLPILDEFQETLKDRGAALDKNTALERINHILVTTYDAAVAGLKSPEDVKKTNAKAYDRLKNIYGASPEEADNINKDLNLGFALQSPASISLSAQQAVARGEISQSVADEILSERNPGKLKGRMRDVYAPPAEKSLALKMLSILDMAEQFAPAVLREREILNKEFAKSKLRPRRKTEIRKIVEAYKSSAPTPYKSSVADLVRPFNVSEAKGKK